MTSLKTLGSIDGYCDAKLGRKPQASQHFIEHHIGEDFAEYVTAYYAAYRAARSHQ